MVVLLFGPGLQGRRGALGRMMETVKRFVCPCKIPKEIRKRDTQDDNIYIIMNTQQKQKTFRLLNLKVVFEAVSVKSPGILLHVLTRLHHSGDTEAVRTVIVACFGCALCVAQQQSVQSPSQTIAGG